MTAKQILAAQREAQKAADLQTAKELARKYGVAWARVKAELDALTAKMQAARAAGIPIDDAWLARNAVLTQLEQRILTELAVYADYAERTISAEQARALAAGSADAATLIGASSSASFTPLQAIVSRTAVGAPLSLLLDRLAPDAAQAASDQLIESVAGGDNPRQTARALQQTLQQPLWKTLRIARTETVGAYRDGSLQTFRANRTALTGWVWIATLDLTTCAVCWAMHGSHHSLDEQFESHPNCRCTPAPLTDDQFSIKVVAGEKRFALLSAADQQTILGPSKYAAYESGQISLAELVQPTLSPVWGGGLRERSLTDALSITA